MSDLGDGMFWMSFADFKKQFEEVSICAVHLCQPGSTFELPSEMTCLPDPSKAPPSATVAEAAALKKAAKGKKAKGGKKQKVESDPKMEGKERYIPPRRQPGALRPTWHESRAKSHFESSDHRLRPAHCFNFTVGGAAEEQAACILMLSQVDSRAVLAPGAPCGPPH